MDISDTLTPKSDQLDYEDFLGGPRTFTIKAVRKGPSAEQPFEVVFEEADRPWRPAKTVRRVIAKCWGTDSTVYVGRRVTLYGDPTVKFGGVEVGGIRMSHASHIDGPVEVPLMVTRGKRASFTVLPLEVAADFVSLLNDAASLAELQAAWEAVRRAGRSSDAVLVELKDKRKRELADG